MDGTAFLRSSGMSCPGTTQLGENMRKLLKPLGIVAVALAMMTAIVSDAEAGRRRHHNNNGRFIAGLATGIIAGVIINHATRRHNNRGYNQSSYRHYSSQPSYEQVCYRGAPRCTSRWDCWVNDWGREVCERVERCNRPLICE